MPNTSFSSFFPYVFLLWLSLSIPCHATESALDLKAIYKQTVDRRLNLPAKEQHYYAELLVYTLQQAGLKNLTAQYMLMVDRSPQVQAVLLFWLADNAHASFIGASPASTGKANGFDYFETPLGVFDHTTHNPDFRSEGSQNSHGLLGYGNKDMRIYDFGWTTARKTWLPEVGQMRLQLHATDPLHSEPKLGSAQSKGCIRIPASLNKLLDTYGVLDSDYEHASLKKQLRSLDPKRKPTPWSGRYMLVVDSRRAIRPAWSPLPSLARLAPHHGLSAKSRTAAE